MRIKSLSFPFLLALAACCLLQIRGQQQQQCQNREPTERGPCLNISSVQSCGDIYSLSFFPNNVTESLQSGLTYFLSYGKFYNGCSDYFDVHLCLALFPVCQDAGSGESSFRLPCRDLCRRVRSDCGPIDVVKDPQCLLYECERYPETDCIGIDDAIVRRTLPPEPVPPSRNVSNKQNATESPSNASFSCPPPNLTFFTNEAKNFAKGWVAFWSVVCYLSTLITLLTFLLDTTRFQYPWRPVVYLALCFHLHTLGYFLALIIGRKNVTCPDGQYVTVDGEWTWAHTPCILVFGLLFYSMMAAFMWWLVLTLSWFLSASFKWTNEAISQFALFYHTAAWILPLVVTVSLLAARVVSADELTGTCFIVRTDMHSSSLGLLLGLIVPLSVFLVIGTLFILIGFVGLLQIRRFMVHRGKERESSILEKLMIRIGIFVAIYIIPAAVLIGCFIYELDARPNWYPVGNACSKCSKPNTAVFMVRVFMFLLIGALTGVWIWSRKTLTSWKLLPQKLKGCVLQQESRTEDTAEMRPRGSPSFRSKNNSSYSSPYMESGVEFTA